MERNILRKTDVMEKVKLSYPTIWRKERNGQFPARVKLGSRMVGWYANEVNEWLETRQRVTR
jgi:prophage regulatory protein